METIQGKTHIQIAAVEDDLDEEEVHHNTEDDEDLHLLFIQNEGTNNKMLTEQRVWETFKPSYIYLDRTSSFHQMCCAN